MTTQDKATVYMLKASIILRQCNLNGQYSEYCRLQKTMAIAMVHESVEAIRGLDRGHNPQSLEQVELFIKDNEFPYYPA